MQKTIISLVRWVGKYFFIATNVLLVCIYLAEFQIAPFVFVLSDNAFSFGLILLAIYSVATTILTFIKLETCSRIFLPVIAICFWVLIIPYAGYHKPELISSAKCNGATYYLTIHPNSPISVDWYHHRLTKWDGFFKYQSDFFMLAAEQAHEVICDERTKQLRIFGFGNSLLYTDGTESRYYDWQWKVFTNNHTYYLESYAGTKRFVVVDCIDENLYSCQITPIIDQSLSNIEAGSLIVDGKTKDVYILFDGKIYSAYGDESRKFNDLASIKTEVYTEIYSVNWKHLFHEQYNLAAYQRNGNYTYVLYMCDIAHEYDQYTECEYIPFSYSTPNQESARLVLDKVKDQLTVYVGEKLIFVYNDAEFPKCDSDCPTSQCYVDGCSIPEQ